MSHLFSKLFFTFVSLVVVDINRSREMPYTPTPFSCHVISICNLQPSLKLIPTANPVIRHLFTSDTPIYINHPLPWIWIFDVPTKPQNNICWIILPHPLNGYPTINPNNHLLRRSLHIKWTRQDLSEEQNLYRLMLAKNSISSTHSK